jgi:hypothetical protein
MRRSVKQNSLRVGCPFCWEWLPAPRLLYKVHSAEGASGGLCECGAFFVIDHTGKSGGQALMDLLALACDGDLDRALAIREGSDFELRTKPLKEQSGRNRLAGHSYLQPKIWALKLKKE